MPRPASASTRRKKPTEPVKKRTVALKTYRKKEEWTPKWRVYSVTATFSYVVPFGSGNTLLSKWFTSVCFTTNGEPPNVQGILALFPDVGASFKPTLVHAREIKAHSAEEFDALIKGTKENDHESTIGDTNGTFVRTDLVSDE